MPKNWKYIKKLLEKEFLCEKLKGHVTYDFTQYAPAPWYQQRFLMKYDDEILLDVPAVKCNWRKECYRPPMDTYTLTKDVSEKVYAKRNLQEFGMTADEVRSLIGYIIEEVFEQIDHYEGIYGVEEIVDAIGVYLHSHIQSSIDSAEYIIRALAVLDRRCGKRTLEKYAKMEYLSIPVWLKRIYRLRFDAEDIRYSKWWNDAVK